MMSLGDIALLGVCALIGLAFCFSAWFNLWASYRKKRRELLEGARKFVGRSWTVTQRWDAKTGCTILLAPRGYLSIDYEKDGHTAEIWQLEPGTKVTFSTLENKKLNPFPAEVSAFLLPHRV